MKVKERWNYENIEPGPFNSPAAPNNTFSLIAAGGASGNPVTFTSNTPTVCSISGASQATILSMGLCTITANQNGNATYDPAPARSISVTIGKGAQVITNFSPPGQFTTNIGDSLTLTATGGGSGNPVVFAASPATVCTLGSGANANRLSVISLGMCTVTANQAGNTNFDPAAEVSATIGFVTASAQLYFIHADHLGTPRVITKAADNAKVWEWKNDDPFGNNAPDENPSGVAGPFKYNLRLPGQYYDQETGTYYNYFRDYDPSTGRYVQSDPIGLAGGINTFGYALGNPLLFIDPDGLDAIVCLYPGAGTAGHVGIGINSSSTVGLYPKSESPGLAAITGTPAAVKPDTKKAEQCKTVSTTAEQDKKMADFIAQITAEPGTYRLGGNNCTNLVRSVLRQAGISTPVSPGPRPFFEALSSKKQ